MGSKRLPREARVLFTGCGTSFHAALGCGRAVQALDLVLGHAPEADVLVAISHEGGTALTREAVEAFDGETWLVTGAGESPLARLVDHVVVATPELEKSYCHTASYTCAVAAGRALQGEDVSGLADAVERELAADPLGASVHERFLVAGTGPTLPRFWKRCSSSARARTLQPRRTIRSNSSMGISPQSIRRCAAFCWKGKGRAAERARDAERALGELGCEVTFLPTAHPVVDIVRFQLLTVDLADAHGIDPDLIRWDEEPWDRARKSYA